MTCHTSIQSPCQAFLPSLLNGATSAPLPQSLLFHPCHNSHCHPLLPLHPSSPFTPPRPSPLLSSSSAPGHPSDPHLLPARTAAAPFTPIPFVQSPGIATNFYSLSPLLAFPPCCPPPPPPPLHPFPSAPDSSQGSNCILHPGSFAPPLPSCRPHPSTFLTLHPSSPFPLLPLLLTPSPLHPRTSFQPGQQLLAHHTVHRRV